MSKKFSIILRESWMIFGMNFNSLNPIIEKEALKQVCSVIIYKRTLPFSSPAKKKKTKVFVFSIWTKTYYRQYSKFLNKVTYDKIVQKMEFSGYRSIWNHLPAP